MINPNREAEQAVIGAIVMNPEVVLPEAVGRLSESDFMIPEYRNVYIACKGLYGLSKPVDIVTVTNNLDESYKALVAQACAAAPTVSHFSSYIDIVAQTARRARAFQYAFRLETNLVDGEPLDNCQELAVKASESLNETENGGTYSAKDLILKFYDTKMKPKSYIKTGIRRLDELTYMDRGDYIVVGARPSAGKTALTLQLMLYMARTLNVVYFSLETSGPKLADRLVANYSSTPLTQIKTGTVADWVKIAESVDGFGKLNFHVVEAAGWTVPQIRAKAVQLKADVIFIDYLSLIKAEGKSLYERVTNISMELHILAQRSKITVIALSQLNRAGNGEPDMTHLRESGQIEQDADVILLLHEVDEEEKKKSDERDKKSISNDNDRLLIIAKNKEGATGFVTLRFIGDYQQFFQKEERYENVK